MTTSEWSTDIHPGYRTKIITAGKAIVEINRPILDAKEQARREEDVIRALAQFGRFCNSKKGDENHV